MKRFAAFVLALCLGVGLCGLPTVAAGYDPSTVYTVQAPSAYVVNTDTNLIIYEKDPELQVQAGGLTKLMNIALILTNYGDRLDDITYTQPQAVSDYVYRTDHADIRIGETITLRQAIYCMLLRNANDAAMGAAYSLSGNDLSGWVTQMNALSQKIGTTGSVWTDACGINAGNTTTARDMYLILRYLMGFDAFVEAAGTYSYEMPSNSRHAASYILTGQNKMLNKAGGGGVYRSAIKGGKMDVVGYEKDSGTQSMVSWAVQNGETYIFAVMNSPDTCDQSGNTARRPAMYETARLLDWVYDSFSIRPALDTTQALCEVKVKYSLVSDSLMLYPADSMMTILPSNSDTTVTQKRFNLPEAVAAPVQAGDVVGTVTLLLAGEEIGTVELVAGQNVARNEILFGFAKLQEFFGSTYFRVVVFLSVLAVAAYAVVFGLHAVQSHNSKKISRH